MPDETTTAPVPGNGVVEIIFPDTTAEEPKMPMDLPDSVGQLMMTETAGNIQGSNRNGRAVADIAMGALQATIVANHAEVGLLEGRTASGIYATPIAAPANGQKTV